MLYFYHGDPYDIEQAVLQLHGCPIRLDSSEVSVKVAMNQALTVDLLSEQPHKLVWLRDVKYEALNIPDATLKAIATSPTNHMVITGERDSKNSLVINPPDRRLKWVKDAIKYGAQVHEFKPLASWDIQKLQQRVLEFATTQAVNLDDAEVTLLSEIAQDGHQLTSVLQQIWLYIEQQEGMPIEAIEELVHPNGNPFELAKALLRGAGLAELHELENSAQPPHPMELFAILGAQLKTWLIVLSMKGRDRGAIAQAAGINPQRIYFLNQELGLNSRHPVTIGQLNALIAAVVHAQLRYLGGEPEALTEMVLELALVA